MQGIYKVGSVAYAVSRYLHHQKDLMDLQMICLHCKASGVDRVKYISFHECIDEVATALAKLSAHHAKTCNKAL